jgi:7-keto-8-aminopelargonate synthetase-like enzyme
MTDIEVPRVVGPRRFRNSDTLVRDSDPVWQAAADNGLLGIEVEPESNNRLVVPDTGHSFVNMVSCAYLGLNSHPAVVDGAIQALRDTGTTELGLSSTRIRTTLLGQLETELGDLFATHVLVTSTCSAASAGVLPLVASGHLAPGGPRVMVFDRHSHFSMNYV